MSVSATLRPAPAAAAARALPVSFIPVSSAAVSSVANYTAAPYELPSGISESAFPRDVEEPVFPNPDDYSFPEPNGGSWFFPGAGASQATESITPRQALNFLLAYTKKVKYPGNSPEVPSFPEIQETISQIYDKYARYGATPGMTGQQLKKLYREISRQAHPDRGGAGFLDLVEDIELMTNNEAMTLNDAKVTPKSMEKRAIAAAAAAPNELSSYSLILHNHLVSEYDKINLELEQMAFTSIDTSIREKLEERLVVVITEIKKNIQFAQDKLGFTLPPFKPKSQPWIFTPKIVGVLEKIGFLFLTAIAAGAGALYLKRAPVAGASAAVPPAVNASAAVVPPAAVAPAANASAAAVPPAAIAPAANASAAAVPPAVVPPAANASAAAVAVPPAANAAINAPVAAARGQLVDGGFRKRTIKKKKHRSPKSFNN